MSHVKDMSMTRAEAPADHFRRHQAVFTDTNKSAELPIGETVAVELLPGNLASLRSLSEGHVSRPLSG